MAPPVGIDLSGHLPVGYRRQTLSLAGQSSNLSQALYRNGG